MKKYDRYLSYIIFIGLWWLVSIIKDSFLFPSPIDVVVRMYQHLFDPVFYQVTSISLIRCLSGLIIALLTGLILGMLAGMFPRFETIFTPFINMIKSIPNISYILIILVWFSTETSSILIVLFILFPIFYTNIVESFHQQNQDLKDTVALYKLPLKTRIFKIYLPASYPYLFAALSTSLGLAFKVGIMAEIIGSVRVGIGKQLKFGQINLDMVEIFAWTVWIILILSLLDYLLQLARKKYKV